MASSAGLHTMKCDRRISLLGFELPIEVVKTSIKRLDFLERNGQLYNVLQDKTFDAKALKEASETKYWLEILFRTNYINNKEYEELKNECEELIRMLTSSINTIRRRLEK